MPCGFFRVGVGRLTGMLSKVASTILQSCRLAPSMPKPMGTPDASVSRLRLAPSLARSVGLGPLFFPAKRGFGHRAIHRLPRPTDAIQFVIFLQAQRPEPLEHPGGRPLLEPQVRRAAGTKARLVQVVPLAARS